MKAQQLWRRANLFHKPQVSPEDRLRALLARELRFDSQEGRRHRQRRWGLALLILAAVIAIAVEVTKASKFDFMFILPNEARSVGFGEAIEGHRQSQVADLVNFNVEQTRGLIDNSALSKLGPVVHEDLYPIEVDISWRPVHTFQPPPYTAPTRTALSPEASLEVAFWRVAVGLNDPFLYKLYLRHYPTGTFVHIAQSKAVRNPPKVASVAEKQRTKPLAAEPDQTTRDKPKVVMDTQCRNNHCSKSNTNECPDDDTASICVKHNYRAIDTTAIQPPRTRQR
jgi:hypothetical protein